MRRRLPAILAVALLLASGAPADEPGMSIDDEVGLLYSSQMHFGPDGIPLVTIGIMEQRERVSVSCEKGCELSFVVATDGEWERKTAETEAGESLTFKVAEAAPGQVQYWCGVLNIPFGEKETLKRAVGAWRERGEKVQVFEAGSVFGIRGHVIDNRVYVLAIRPQDTEEKATEEAAKVFTKTGSKTFVHAYLDRRPSGKIWVQADSALDLVTVRPKDGGLVTVHRVEFGQGYRWHGFEDRKFSGQILVTLGRDGRLVVVNRINAERLLEGLVPAEIPRTAPMEAIKAQAVVARGAVFAKIGTRHLLDPYLLCASTHCQVYAGVGVEHPRTSRAVRSTKGELLFRGSDLVDSVYSASCGGHTEDNDAVWSDPPKKSLRGRPDMPLEAARKWLPLEKNLSLWLRSFPPAWCNLATHNKPGIFRWQRIIPSAEMDRLIAKQKPIGQIMAIQVLDRGVSGRVKAIRVVGSEGDLVVQREWPIRQLLGMLRSGMFEVGVELDADQMPTNFHFIGGGWGHGAGMCQLGAIGMAEHNHDYRQILSHYYNGAKVFRLYSDCMVLRSERDTAQVDGIDEEVAEDGGYEGAGK
jgi:SpoIID/LytB domain protein